MYVCVCVYEEAGIEQNAVWEGKGKEAQLNNKSDFSLEYLLNNCSIFASNVK